MRAFITLMVLVALEASVTAAPSAEQLYDEGQQAFVRGDYATAIARWQSAYELSKLPLLVLNIAQAYRMAGDCPHALSTYRQYVRLDPTSEQRGPVDDVITELEPECGQRAPSPVDHFARPVENRDSGNKLKVAGLVTTGAGAAMLVTGLLVGHRASTLGDEVTRDCAVSCDWAIEKTKEQDGKRDATVGKILDGVGIAGVALGIGMYVYGARKDRPAFSIEPGGHGATLTWSGSW